MRGVDCYWLTLQEVLAAGPAHLHLLGPLPPHLDAPDSKATVEVRLLQPIDTSGGPTATYSLVSSMYEIRVAKDLLLVAPLLPTIHSTFPRQTMNRTRSACVPQKAHQKARPIGICMTTRTACPSA